MFSVTSVLSSAGVNFRPYVPCKERCLPPARGVFITSANQLIGSYSNLKRYREKDTNYFGWHAHHIVEKQDLERLGVTHLFPDPDEQICVLLPERGHVGRINSVLQRQNPTGVRATAAELLSAYRTAYAFVGNYCGGGEVRIRQELMAIVSAIFRMAGLK